MAPGGRTYRSARRKADRSRLACGSWQVKPAQSAMALLVASRLHEPNGLVADEGWVTTIKNPNGPGGDHLGEAGDSFRKR